jgi:hypothetical protein
VYGEIGARYPEAWAQLLAAESDDDVDLAPAQSYFERAGATPYVHRCEAALSRLDVGSRRGRT